MPVQIIRQDITKMHVDAIVNAANESLLGGGGVDGAIHRAAGPQLLEECITLGGCATGEAKATKGYRLPAKYVIHTVGPIWQGGLEGEKELLAACYRNSLRLAKELGCESVAMPMISTGAYGFPKELAFPIAMDTVRQFLENEDDDDMIVYLVVFGPSAFRVSLELFRDVHSFIDENYVDENSNRRLENTRRGLWHTAPKEAAYYDASIMDEEEIEFAPKPPAAPLMSAKPDWEELLRQTDEGFSGMLLRKIDEKGITDADCYKRANVDRKLFHKIKTQPGYKPSKTTVFAFIVALELPIREAKEMLEKAGFSMTHSSKLDIVVEYFILHGRFDIMEINEVLFTFDLPLLGSVVA